VAALAFGLFTNGWTKMMGGASICDAVVFFLLGSFVGGENGEGKWVGRWGPGETKGRRN